MIDISWIFAGLVVAVYGAKLVVDGGAAIALRFNIPTIVIGMTVIAFGVSTPELSVNVHSALGGSTGLALGNILGSNLFNICVILGVAAFITPLTVNRNSAAKDLPMTLIAAVVIGVMGNQIYLDKLQFHELFPSDGIVLLCFFAIFMYYTYREGSEGATHRTPVHTRHIEQTHADKGLSMARAALYVPLGLAGLVYGGDWIVGGAQGLATRFGMEERLIGLLIVGPGTSVPNLIAALVAASKRNVDMVIGNVLGSNLFNIFFTMGVTAIIRPVPLDLALNVAIVFNASITLLLVLHATVLRHTVIRRQLGVALLVAYGGYLAYAIMA